MISYKDYIFDQIQNNKILNNTSKFYLRLLLQEEWEFIIINYTSSTNIKMSNHKRIIEIGIDKQYEVHLSYYDLTIKRGLSVSYLVYQKELYDVILCAVTNYRSGNHLTNLDVINEIKKYYDV